MVIFLGQRYIW